MKIREVYVCEICGTEYNERDHARACEGATIPDAPLRKIEEGESVHVRFETGSERFCDRIVDRAFVHRLGEKHVWMLELSEYVIRKGSETYWIAASEVL